MMLAAYRPTAVCACLLVYLQFSSCTQLPFLDFVLYSFIVICLIKVSWTEHKTNEVLQMVDTEREMMDTVRNRQKR